MSKLAALLSGDYALLRAYLGDVAFNRLAARLPGQAAARLPDVIAQGRASPRQKEAAELARLEQAQTTALVAPDVQALDAEALARLAARGARVGLHPSASVLAFQTNAVSIAAALRCGEVPPPAKRLQARQAILVWRQGDGPRFRMLGREEEEALTRLQHGLSAASLLAGPKPSATKRKNPLHTYLMGWMEAGLLIEKMKA